MGVRSGKIGKHHSKIGMIVRPPGNYEDLAVFVDVARELSFVAAARTTRMPASSVSRAVARLEDALGVRLLQRTSRRVVLTAEGQQLLLRASPAVDDLGNALRGVVDAGSQVRGIIRVTAPAFTGSTRVAGALAEFARSHPGVTIELDASNAMRDVLEDRFDLAIRVGPLVDADLVARRLWDSEFGVFAARSLVKGARTLTRAQLESLPAVVTRSGPWRFLDPAGTRIELTPKARFAVNDPRGAVDVARRGIGLALVPLEAVPEGDSELIRIHPDFGEPEPAHIFAVHPSRRLLPLRVKLALDWLVTSPARAHRRPSSGPSAAG